MLAAHVALLAKKAKHAVKIVYDRDEDIAATTKRHPARTQHRLAVDAQRRDRRDRRRRRDGRRRVPDAVAGRAVARRAARGRAVSLPGRARARPRRRDEPSAARRVPRLRCAADDVRVRAADAEARASRAARIRSRCASGSRCARATRPRPGRCSAFSVGTDEVIAAIEQRRGPAAGARRHQRERLRRCGAAAASCFYFHGAGFTGSGEQRLAGRATVARTADGRYEVRSSSTDIGQGAITIFTQIAAAALGVDAVASSTSSIRRRRRCPTAGRRSRAARAWWSAGSSRRACASAAAARSSTAGERARPASEVAVTHAVRAAAGHPLGRRDVHRRGVSRATAGPRASSTSSVDLDTYEVHDRSLRAGDRRRQGDQPGRS